MACYQRTQALGLGYCVHHSIPVKYCFSRLIDQISTLSFLSYAAFTMLYLSRRALTGDIKSDETYLATFRWQLTIRPNHRLKTKPCADFVYSLQMFDKNSCRFFIAKYLTVPTFAYTMCLWYCEKHSKPEEIIPTITSSMPRCIRFDLNGLAADFISFSMNSYVASDSAKRTSVLSRRYA